MSKKQKAAGAPRRHAGIRWPLFAYLAAFTVLILLALWVFQIRLLSFFYEREKFSELEAFSGELADVSGEADFADRVTLSAQEKRICVRVFAITEGRATEVASIEAGNRCLIHSWQGETVSDMYEKALGSGGSFSERMALGAQEAARGEGEFRLPGAYRRTGVRDAIRVTVTDTETARYLILLDSELTPLDSTVRTLEIQFIWIAIFTLIAAFLLAMVLSHVIAKPLTAITDEAKKLADGNYKTEFKGRGYREVQELAETLNFAAGEISKTDALQKELIANISHDLRTPLTMIRGYGELMRDIPGENSPENVQIIIDETTRLSDLVSDLMDLSRLQAGVKQPEYSVFDLNETVVDTLRRYETLTKREGYRFETETEGEAFVRADRTMILQVICNLVNNAVNYSGASRRVRVTVKKNDGVVRLSVIDEGEGIPPERIKDIWDRYYRVDRVHKRAVTGTGLGLSIVKSVLETHGAHYGVDSAVGYGSVFWFELPLVSPESETK